jgi:hypothetical protein
MMEYPARLIFLDRSPLGIRTRDLLHGLACFRRLMMVSRVRLPQILPPMRANMGEHWRTAKHQKPRKIRQWRTGANAIRGVRLSPISTRPALINSGLGVLLGKCAQHITSPPHDLVPTGSAALIYQPLVG